MREALRSIDPLLALDRIRTMEQAIAESSIGLRHLSSLMGICGAIAIALSIAGIYSIMTYTVSQRTGELGVRMALGATRADVMRSTLKHAAILTGAGSMAGIALALLIGQSMENSVLGIVAFDVTTLVVASLGLAATTLVAFLPVRRLLRLDGSDPAVGVTRFPTTTPRIHMFDEREEMMATIPSCAIPPNTRTR